MVSNVTGFKSKERVYVSKITSLEPNKMCWVTHSSKHLQTHVDSPRNRFPYLV